MRNFTRLRKITRSQSGSSLVMALVCVAVIGGIAAAAAQLATQMNAQTKSDVESKNLLTFTQALETVAGTNLACLGQGGLDGIKFKSAGGAFAPNNFSQATAADVTVGQEMSLGTQLSANGAARFIAQTGAVYTPFNLTVDRLSFRKSNPVSATQFNGEILLQAHIGTHAFAPRTVGSMSIVVDGTNTVTACTFSESAQMACEAMGCKYNAGAPVGKQKCVCGYPPLTCPAGSYISGIDQSTTPPRAICDAFKADCSDPAFGGKGDGYFLAGFDTNGDPICQPVEGSIAGPTPACSGGATTTASSNAATPAGCFCAGSTTWNGSSCVAASPVCTGGATTTVDVNAASPAGCYCAGTDTWNGSACVRGYVPPGGCGDWYFYGRQASARCTSGVGFALGGVGMGGSCPITSYSSAAADSTCSALPVHWCIPCGPGSVIGTTCTINPCAAGGPPP